MRVGILDLLSDTLLGGWAGRVYSIYFRKQFMAITPQAVAVWCRSLGHQVHYATYWGQIDPLSLIPDDADVVFIGSYTQSSALAYALATALKQRGALTVIGGPHARSFPTDCARFFDIVVKDCDRNLVDDILRRRFDPPAIVTSGRALKEFPSIEERMPEIRVAAFHRGRQVLTSVVPMLSSIGCPYTCGFCVDWNSQYVTLPAEQLHADLDYLSRHYPKLVDRLPRPELRRALRRDHGRARAGAQRPAQSLHHGELALDPEGRTAGAPDRDPLRLHRAGHRIMDRLLEQVRGGGAQGPRQIGEDRRPAGGGLAPRAWNPGQLPVRLRLGRRRGAGRTDQRIHQAPAAGLAHDQHTEPLRRHAALRRAPSRRTHPEGDALRVLLQSLSRNHASSTTTPRRITTI